MIGGGLVIGSVNLLGGEPGVGKSTLLTGLALQWSKQGVRVLYIAGEESPSQIKMRAERLGFNSKEDENLVEAETSTAKIIVLSRSSTNSLTMILFILAERFRAEGEGGGF